MIVPAMLVAAKGATPRPVRLEISESELLLDPPGGQIEELPIRLLVRRGEDRGVVRLGRRGRPGWELRVSGNGGREVLAMLPGPKQRIGRLAAMGWHIWPVAAAVIALGVAQIPANWAAALTPQRLELRMLPQIYEPEDRCQSPAGERAIRGLIARFDPRLASTVKIDVVSSPAFVLTALPDHRLLISNTALANVQPDALAALIAHQLVHLQNGDAVEAVFRARGPVETFGRMLFGPQGDVDGTLMKFSEAQEERADRASMGMLVAAGISPRSAADLFLESDTADGLAKGFGQAQSVLHPGPQWRALDWVASAKQNPGHGPALSPAQVDAITHFCPATEQSSK